MNLGTLIRKNLGRKKLRTGLTLASVAVAFVLFVILGALARAFTLGIEVAGADRLFTMHKVSFTQLLPLSYVKRVQGIDGVARVVHQTWFGAFFQDPKRQFGLFPVELPELFAVYPEYTVSDDERRALLANRQGLLVGRALAEQYGWKVGDRVPIQSTIYPQENGSYAWDFDIEAIFDGDPGADGADELQAFAHYDYVNEGRAFATDTVGWLVVKVEDPADAEMVAAAIDERFRNSPVETKTSSEEGWVAGFAAQFGNIGLMVRIVLACVFFTLLLVAGNTMAQAVRERTAEMAVLKTIGFSDGQVMWTILAESLTISLIGGALGLALGTLFVEGAGTQLAQFLPGLSVNARILLTGAGLAMLLGLVAGAVPAWQVRRMRVVDALAGL